MKKVFYLGKIMPLTKAIILFFICLNLCISAVQAQPIYFSSFADPTGKYVVTEPACAVRANTPSISSPETISSAPLTDRATLAFPALALGVGCSGGYRLRADLNLNELAVLPASPTTPYYAGFKVSVSSAVLLNLLGNNLLLRTYKDGVPADTALSSLIGLSLLQPGQLGNLAFQTTRPFNQVSVELGLGLLDVGLFSSLEFHYAFASTQIVPVILPVKLTSFSATAENKSVTVNWTTASETNVAKYELQRSSNGGATYSTVTTVAAKGSATTETKYSYADGTALSGNYTYRLKVIDKDGGEEYSKLVVVKITTSANWTIYPTLLSSGTAINASFATSGGGKAQVQLANLQGQILRSASTNTENKLTVNTSGLSAGIYVLKMYKDGQLQASEKVVIQ